MWLSDERRHTRPFSRHVVRLKQDMCKSGFDWRSALLARPTHVTIPARNAANAASTRLRTPSLTKIPEIWVFTVVSLR